jgi:hypothetical protein
VSPRTTIFSLENEHRAINMVRDHIKGLRAQFDQSVDDEAEMQAIEQKMKLREACQMLPEGGQLGPGNQFERHATEGVAGEAPAEGLPPEMNLILSSFLHLLPSVSSSPSFIPSREGDAVFLHRIKMVQELRLRELSVLLAYDAALKKYWADLLNGPLP